MFIILKGVKFRINYIFILLVFLLHFKAYANNHNNYDTIYLDPVNALPGGSGKNTEDPAIKVPESIKGKPGTCILYKRGIVVRGPFEYFSSSQEAPTIVGAYGNGPKPVFMNSMGFDSAENWIMEENNIWRYKKNLRNSTGANIIYNKGEYCGAMRWHKENLFQQGDWFMADTLGGKVNKKDYLHVYSEGNPAKVYDAIEFVPEGTFINLRKEDSFIIIQDLAIKNAGTHGIQLNGSKNITIRGCDVSYIGGAIFTPRIGINDLWVRYGNALEIWNKGFNIKVEGCSVFENYDAGFVAQGSCVPDCIDSVVVRNNIFWNNGFDNFDNSWGEGLSRIYFENNTCVDAGDGWPYETEGKPRHSEFLPDTIGWHVFLDSYAVNQSTIFIRNNIFYNATQNELVKINKLPEEGWPNVIMDYNCYYQKNNNDPLIQVLENVFYADDFEQYKRSTGKDIHSIVADPLFVNPQNKDFRLSKDSPCIDKGTYIGNKKDFSNGKIPIGKAPDIGAYEFDNSDY